MWCCSRCLRLFRVPCAKSVQDDLGRARESLDLGPCKTLEKTHAYHVLPRARVLFNPRPSGSLIVGRVNDGVINKNQGLLEGPF